MAAFQQSESSYISITSIQLQYSDIENKFRNTSIMMISCNIRAQIPQSTLHK